MNVNSVEVIGRLTRDPELKYTPKGTALCTFGIAWDDGVKREDAKPKAHFFDCQAWAKLAEAIAETFKKGDQIWIKGRLDYQQWEDKTSGKQRSKIAINVVFAADSVMAAEKTDSKAAPPPPARPAAPATKAADAKPPDDDDDVPF